jgi:hypothetical protein
MRSPRRHIWKRRPRSTRSQLKPPRSDVRGGINDGG